jgi:heme exporter protein B
VAGQLWWIVHKDLVSECRAWRVWPAMLLFGLVVALVFAAQVDLPADQRTQIAGGLLWLAIFFAGMQAVEHSCAAEREEGCWDGLLLYPIGPAAIYLAKLAVNAVALASLECLLIPAFAALSDVPLMSRPGAMLLVALLGNVGICAVGTLLSGLVAGVRRSGSLLVLIVLPLAIPVVLAAAEATRLVAEDRLGPEWWRWVHLLAAFAAVFVTAGATLFDFVIRD